MFIIAGLGNPDRQYEGTRHNVGFDVIDRLADKYNIAVDVKKHRALLGKGVIEGQKVILAKPQTYMNLSGTSVEKAASFYKIPPEQIIVIFDDISLDVGRLRLRRKGSHGGHNGIRNIIDYLQTDGFPRIKVGVGAKPHPDYNLADWVLSVYTEDEMKKISEAAKKCLGAVEMIIRGEFEAAMSRYNG